MPPGHAAPSRFPLPSRALRASLGRAARRAAPLGWRPRRGESWALSVPRGLWGCGQAEGSAGTRPGPFPYHCRPPPPRRPGSARPPHTGHRERWHSAKGRAQLSPVTAAALRGEAAPLPWGEPHVGWRTVRSGSCSSDCTSRATGSAAAAAAAPRCSSRVPLPERDRLRRNPDTRSTPQPPAGSHSSSPRDNPTFALRYKLPEPKTTRCGLHARLPQPLEDSRIVASLAALWPGLPLCADVENQRHGDRSLHGVSSSPRLLPHRVSTEHV